MTEEEEVKYLEDLALRMELLLEAEEQLKPVLMTKEKLYTDVEIRLMKFIDENVKFQETKGYNRRLYVDMFSLLSVIRAKEKHLRKALKHLKELKVIDYKINKNNFLVMVEVI